MESSVEYKTIENINNAKYTNLYYIDSKFYFLTTKQHKNINIKPIKTLGGPEHLRRINPTRYNLLPIVKYFENEIDLNNYVLSLNLKELTKPTLRFSHYYYHNISHGLYDALYPIFLCYLRFFTGNEYDSFNRKTKETVYNEKGELKKTYNTVIDDENHVFYDYYSDSLVNFLAIKETRLNNKGRVFIEAILDGQDRLLEKNVFYYDENERIVEIKKYDMIRKNVSEDYKIPVQVHTYEYD